MSQAKTSRLAGLAGRRVIVWGAGREGRSAARAALSASAADVVAVVDTEPSPETAKRWGSAGLTGVPLLAGEACLGAVGAARAGDVLVLSPSVSRYRDEMLAAERRDVTVTNGTELFLAERAADTVAVTGSKGKSTVTRLAAHLLGAVGREAVPGGNVGLPLLDLLDEPREVVAEISSYQAALVRTGPRLAVLTSLFPEHLPWHGGEDGYYGDKLRLFAAQGGQPGRGLVNGADAGVRSMLGRPELAGVRTFAAADSRVTVEGEHVVVAGEKVLDVTSSPLPGEHNRANVAAAVAVLDAAGVDVAGAGSALEAALAGFAQLPHRLETVGVVGGVTFVDDSLATTPQAAVAACEAFPDRPLTLLVGGLDRGVDYRPLLDYLRRRADSSKVGIVLMGPVGRRLAPELSGPSTLASDDVADAVTAAAGLTPPGGLVLLAPAAPSPPEYGDYEARARAFRAGVERLLDALPRS